MPSLSPIVAQFRADTSVPGHRRGSTTKAIDAKVATFAATGDKRYLDVAEQLVHLVQTSARQPLLATQLAALKEDPHVEAARSLQSQANRNRNNRSSDESGCCIVSSSGSNGPAAGHNTGATNSNSNSGGGGGSGGGGSGGGGS